MEYEKHSKVMRCLFYMMMLAGSIFYFSNTTAIYLFWILTVFFNALCLLDVLKNKSIKKVSIITFFIIVLPLFWSWLNFVNFIDKSLALTYTFITIFYTVTCLNINSFLSKLRSDMIYDFITKVTTIWILLSIAPIINQLFDPLIPVSGLFANRNAFAMICILFIVSNLFLLKNGSVPGRNKYFNKLNIFCLVLFILLTGSVKGFFSLLIVVFVYNREKINLKKIITLLIFSVVLLSILMTDSVISERIGYVVSSYGDNSTLRISQSAYIRQFYVSEGIRLILESPLFGLGILQSKFYLIPEYFYVLYERGDLTELVGQYSHNNYIEVGLNGGFFSLLISYLPILYILSSCCFNTQLRKRLGRKYVDLIYCLALLKIFNDFGMVTFYQFPYILQLTAIFFIYSKGRGKGEHEKKFTSY